MLKLYKKLLVSTCSFCYICKTEDQKTNKQQTEFHSKIFLKIFFCFQFNLDKKKQQLLNCF